VVSANNAGGASGDSAEQAATPQLPPPPAAPTNLAATGGNGQIVLTWTASGGATSYTVKRASFTGGPYTDFVQPGIAGTTYTNTGLVNGTTYYYVVSASSANGESSNSAEKSATPQTPPPPAAPTGLTATASSTQVVLTWTASSGATSYTVKRSLTAGGPYTNFVQQNITGTTYTNTGLVNGTTYYYVVTASNANGESANSAEKSATPVAPTAAISNLVVNDTATTNPPAGTDGIANSLQWSIQTNFQVDVVAFGDRTVKVTAVPTAGNTLLGKAWIRTAADSKNYAGAPLATFTTGGSSVYVAVDNRHNGTGTKPTWLDATWVDQGYDITITEGTTARPYSVYRKTVMVGSTVTLPTINSPTAPCYIVIVQ
jgi:FlaG/FlaF family flagellin (archaellin)